MTSKLDQFLGEVKSRLEKATPAPIWRVWFNLPETIDDLDLMRTGRVQDFVSKDEAEKFMSEHTFKNRPEYWQPYIRHIQAKPDGIHTDLTRLLAIVERMRFTLKDIAETDDHAWAYQCLAELEELCK